MYRGELETDTPDQKLVGRDFQLEDGSLALVWEMWRADQLGYVLHGVLKLEAR